MYKRVGFTDYYNTQHKYHESIAYGHDLNKLKDSLGSYERGFIKDLQTDQIVWTKGYTYYA